ncbi:MAG: hemagglutinin repeat-containing protein, partial [Campylobacter sp.]|nr:hemagglutinin repeat-containing protein [Campylobacter sp.]
NTTNDTTIKGANLRADNQLNLNTNNLTLESLRDKYQANSKSSSIGVGISFSGSTNSNHFANGNLKTSSANANYSNSKSNSIIKQTNLSSITANEVNINAKGNTHLKGSMIAAGSYDENGKFNDNGNLNLTTNSLTFENLSNTAYSKDKSFAISANMGLNQNEVTKFTQDDYRPQNMQNTIDKAKQEKANSLNNPSVSNISLGTSNSVSVGKTLATIGNGNLQISNLDDSDDLDRLNRNVDNIQKDILNSQTSTYAQADIDNRLFTENGRESIKHDLLIMSDLLSNGMPKENSTNPIEASIGKTLNFLGDITLGIIPSNENKGGILGQLGATIVADPNFVILNDDSGSNNVFIPGIMTKEDQAYNQASYMFAPKEYNYEDTFAYSNYKIYHNPTRGLIADLAESAVDLFGGTSGIAKQIGYEIKNNPNNNYVALSQGSLIANSGIKYYGLKENIVYIGTPLYTKPNNGITVNSKNDVIHDPTNLFNIPLYKNGQIFYEHIWSNDYKGIGDKSKQ